jgi:hypothetical protein
VLFISEYRIRSNMSKDDTSRLMTIFGERGEEDGTIAHYIKTDGSGGVVIIDQDDAVKAYETVLAYSEYLEFTVTPALRIDDAVGPILAYIGAA